MAHEGAPVYRDEPQTPRPRASTLWPPAHVTERFEIIWDAEGEPFGLCIDDRYYRVRPSPRLRHKPGHRGQLIFEVRS